MGALIAANRDFIMKFEAEQVLIKRMPAADPVQHMAALQDNTMRYDNMMAPDGMSHLLTRRANLRSQLRDRKSAMAEAARKEHMRSSENPTLKEAMLWQTEYTDPDYFQDQASKDAALTVRKLVDERQDRQSNYELSLKKTPEDYRSPPKTKKKPNS